MDINKDAGDQYQYPPLTEPLENIEQIKQALSHEWQPSGSAPDGVDLLWYIPKWNRSMRVDDKEGMFCMVQFYELGDVFWQPLPPPPKVGQ